MFKSYCRSEKSKKLVKLRKPSFVHSRILSILRKNKKKRTIINNCKFANHTLFITIYKCEYITPIISIVVLAVVAIFELKKTFCRKHICCNGIKFIVGLIFENEISNKMLQ